MRRFSSFSLPLFLFFFLFFFINGVTSQDTIKTTCKLCAKGNPNINVDFCKTSLQAAPASQCAALRGLGRISIRLIGDNVTDTRCHIKKLLKDKNRSRIQKEYLKDCFEFYSDAMDTIRQAMSSFNSKRFFDANLQISSVMDAASTCEDGFHERTGLVSPLTKRNNDTFQLSAISLALMNLLQKTDHSH